jgi:DNA-binding transcriptional ArsR family regulator
MNQLLLLKINQTLMAYKCVLFKNNVFLRHKTNDMVVSKIELFEEDLQTKANMFKALAHPARLQILRFLAQTKTCISGDISEELPLSRTTVNQHLNELKEAGLIKGHMEGVKMKYCLDSEKVKEMNMLLTSFLDEIQLPDNYTCQ